MRKPARREPRAAGRSRRDPPPQIAAPASLGASRLTRRHAFLASVLVLATFCTYIPVVWNDFILLDDRLYVTTNAVVLRGLSVDGLLWAFSTTHASNWHPLTWLSHMLDCEMFGTNPLGHHVTSLVVHCVNVVLLFAFLVRATGQAWPAACVAGLFGLHPLHTESVAWVAERKDVLSTCFGFLALLAYERYARRPGAARYALVVILLAVGLMAKPMLVTWPCVMLLLDYWPLRRWQKAGGMYSLRQLFVEKLPLFGLAVLSSVITLYAQRRGAAVISADLVSLEARVTNALVSYALYLKATLWPAGLAIYYPHTYRPAPAWQTVVAAILLSAFTITSLCLRRRRPYLPLGWLWFLGTLVPVIGLVQVGSQARADRYTYVPLVGIFIAVVWGIRDATAGRRIPRPVLAGGGAAVAVALAVATSFQLRYWRNSITLFERALEVTTENAAVHGFLAQTLVGRGQRKEAIAHYAEAVRIQPNDFGLRYNLGLALFLDGQFDGAATHFAALAERYPQIALAHLHLGGSLAHLGRFAESLPHSLTALRMDPGLVHAHYHLGMAYAGLGRYDDAVAQYRRWLRATPDSAEGHFAMGDALLALGRMEEAAQHYTAGVNLTPSDSLRRARLEEIQAQLGRDD